MRVHFVLFIFNIAIWWLVDRINWCSNELTFNEYANFLTFKLKEKSKLICQQWLF